MRAEVGRLVSLKRGRADAILDRVIEAVRGWSELAEQVGVSEAWAAEVARHRRLEL